MILQIRFVELPFSEETRLPMQKTTGDSGHAGRLSATLSLYRKGPFGPPSYRELLENEQVAFCHYL